MFGLSEASFLYPTNMRQAWLSYVRNPETNLLNRKVSMRSLNAGLQQGRVGEETATAGR